MRYYWWLGFFALILVLIAPFKSVKAQTTEIPNLSIRCLSATIVDSTNSQHIIKLEGAGFSPNQAVEIWRDTEEGFVCAIDKNGDSLCGSEALSAENYGREFQILELTKEQVVADSTGRVFIGRVNSRTERKLIHQFYGAQTTPPEETAEVLPELSADEYGLKLLTFLKEQETSGASDLNNCTTVYWDPYGRVFDSVSLEPIINVAVHLLDKDKNRVPNQPGVLNPNITKADGAFSFFVPDGSYYLDPKTDQYTYPLTDAEISTLSTTQSVYTELYNGAVIVQQGAVQHRDIPLKPLDSNNPTSNRPLILNKSIVSFTQNGESYQKISGLVSHPKSKINIYSGTRLVGTVESDQYGNFEILIANSLIDQTLPLEIIAEKAALIVSQSRKIPLLSKLNLIIPPVEAQSAIDSEPVKIDPKPNYLVGFVYDQNQKIAPLSTVQVVIPAMDNRLYAAIKADANGFIFIPRQSLPPVEYQLVIRDPSNKIIGRQKSADFINANKNFLEREKVNLLSPQTETVAKIVDKVKTQGNRYLSTNLPSPTAISTNPETEKTGSPVIYILLTFLVLVAVAILIVTLTKFRKRYHSEEL